MKVSIVELRDMIAEAVRRTVREGKKKVKVVPPSSEEAAAQQQARYVRALPGYAVDPVLDMSQPLGPRSLVKRQGNSNMGNWTSEQRRIEAIQRLVRIIVAEEIRARRSIQGRVQSR